MMSSASKPGSSSDRDAERVDHLADQAHLLAEDVGRRLAVGLVGVDRLVAERRLGPVERHRHAGRAGGRAAG